MKPNFAVVREMQLLCLQSECIQTKQVWTQICRLRAHLKLPGSTGKLHLAWEWCTSLRVSPFTLNYPSAPEQQAANAGTCLPCQTVFFEYLSPVTSGTDSQAARQRPCSVLGAFGLWLGSVQGAGVQCLPRAWAGASVPLHEPTGPRVYCNLSHKAGTLGLPCTVKCYVLFLSLQYSTKSLNHS